jgi:pyruvate dehydrogenase E1 component beta subunit
MKMNMIDAINLALMQEMKRDKNVVLLGEDIGEDGGVFRVTDGLAKKFGNDRVMDAPVAESGIVGTSIGMAIVGLKPVGEIQFDGFSLPAFDQLVNHASRIRNRSRGKFSCPMVLRIPIGGGIKALEHHSDSPENYFIHTPGLKVVMPSTPYDAKGMLAYAIRDPDPVIFFEPKRLYRLIKQEVPEKEYLIPFGRAKIRKSGSDVTLITYGASTKVALDAVKDMSDISVEVIDLRSLSPVDWPLVLKSVEKTGKVVVVHEAQRSGGFGGEIVSRIAEKALYSLQAPVERVTGYDIIVPLPKQEKLYLVSEQRIIDAVERVMKNAL